MSAGESSERPSKRVRLDGGEMAERGDAELGSNIVQNKRNKWHTQQQSNHVKHKSRSGQQHTSNQNDLATAKVKSHAQRTFIQPSVITSGDKGIFVTCDKGKEKRCLIELGDMVEEYLEKHHLLVSENHASQHFKPGEGGIIEQDTPNSSLANNDDGISSDESDLDIESAISAELSSLRQPHSATANSTSTSTPSKPFQLIPLDVPCVSFLRFHPSYLSYEAINPTTLIHDLCETVMRTAQAKSRFVKRLSPIMWIGKILSRGLERACEEVIDKVFAVENRQSETETTTATEDDNSKPAQSETKTGYTFAIRPSIRNNDRLSREEIIRVVADRINSVGHGTHQVDLKNYELGVLVEVYRGWISMAVVQNKPTGSTPISSSRLMTDQKEENGSIERRFEYGFEELKRFNLAEIQTEAMNRMDTG